MVNTAVTYTVGGFAPNADVKLQWKRVNGSKFDVLTFRTDATGAATGTIKVPATPGGATNRVLFVQGSVIAQVPFEVVARIKVSPDPAQRGQTIDISLRGYGRGEVVKIRWKRGGGFVQVGQVTTSNTGSANLRIPVPGWVPDGEHSVRGDGTVFRQQTNGVTISGGPPVTSGRTPTAAPEPSATQIPTATPSVTATSTPEALATVEPTSVPTEPATTPIVVESPAVTPEVTLAPTPVPEDAMTPEAA